LRSKNRTRTDFSVLALLCCATSLSVQSPAGAADQMAVATEEIFLNDFPVVLSATRLVQARSDAPASITVIDREMIKASGAEEVPDLLRLVPGFQIAHDKQDIWIPDPVGATYHGLSDPYARRIQVLVDGRSVYDPAIGGVRWDQLALEVDDIERIEVIRGPNGAAYGANAFLAAVNIISRHPADVPTVYTKLVSGSSNYVKGVARYSQKSESFDYRFGVSARSDDGLEGEHDSRTMVKSNFRGEYRADNGDILELQFGLSGGPHQAGDVGTDFERDTSSVSNFQQIVWRRAPSADESYQVQYYRSYFSANDRFSITDFPIIDQSMVTERNNVEFQHTKRWGDAVRTVWGLEARQDSSKAPDGWFYGIDQVTNDLYRAFVNAEWRYSPKLVANFGGMFEQNGITGAGFSPRAAINYHLSDQNTLRASASQGLRTPSLFEEHANGRADYLGVTPVYSFVSPGGLEAERITSYEVGFVTRSRNSKLVADVRVYQDYISNLIDYPELPPSLTGPQYTYVNQGEASVSGVELDVNYRPTTSTRLVFAYAYADQSGSYPRYFDGVSSYVVRPTDPATPNHTASLLAIQKLSSDISASVGVYYVGRMGWFNNLSPAPPYLEGEIPEYTKVDFRLAKRLRGRNFKGLVELVGQNLAGSHYDYTSSVEQDRRIYIKLRIGAD